MTKRLTRLAPSPTGALHLGNARTFLINWAMARQAGWSIIMRIEDLDGPRVKQHATEQVLDTLCWLGIDYDGEVLHQSHDLQPYEAAMQQLAQQGAVFACSLTRREIEQAASAPHGDQRELRYEPALRPSDPDCRAFGRLDTNYRLLVSDEWIDVDDEVTGRRPFNPHREVGDFVVWTRRGVPAYQLAVVVDDVRQSVTDVVRGEDLLPSAARQILLYRALGLSPPRWWHLPLVLGPDGRRLAKRHGDTRVATYREMGVRPERVIALMAAWSGVIEFDPQKPRDMTAEEFRDRFVLDTLPRSPITFTEEHHQWLLR